MRVELIFSLSLAYLGAISSASVGHIPLISSDSVSRTAGQIAKSLEAKLDGASSATTVDLLKIIDCISDSNDPNRSGYSLINRICGTSFRTSTTIGSGRNGLCIYNFALLDYKYYVFS